MPQVPESSGGFTFPAANWVPPPAVLVSGPWCCSDPGAASGMAQTPPKGDGGQSHTLFFSVVVELLRAVSGSQAACSPFSCSLWLPRTVPNWDPLQCPSSLALLAPEGENRTEL